MTDLPADFPDLFRGQTIPADAEISDAAAEALASFLWSVAEKDLQAEAAEARKRKSPPKVEKPPGDK